MTSLGEVGGVGEETPTISGAIQAIVRSLMLGMNTCMPATVEAYNATQGTVDVQPSIKRVYIKDNEAVNLPVINSVPVCFPRAGQAAVTLPIKPGDSVLLVFSQRSLERWKFQGGIVQAGDPRHHDLSDAIAIPGVYPIVEPLLGVDPDNLVMQNTLGSKVTVTPTSIIVTVGLAKFEIDATGSFSMGDGITELLGLLRSVIDETLATLDNILALTVPTGVGPSGTPINATAFAVNKTKLEELGLALDSITL